MKNPQCLHCPKISRTTHVSVYTSDIMGDRISNNPCSPLYMCGHYSSRSCFNTVGEVSHDTVFLLTEASHCFLCRPSGGGDISGKPAVLSTNPIPIVRLQQTRYTQGTFAAQLVLPSGHPAPEMHTYSSQCYQHSAASEEGQTGFSFKLWIMKQTCAQFGTSFCQCFF